MNDPFHALEKAEDRWFMVLACLGAAPLFSYALLVLFAVYACAVVGHWPSYGDPDPKTLPIGHTGIIWIMFIGSIASIPVYLLIFVVEFAHRRFDRALAKPKFFLSSVEILGLAACICGILLWNFASQHLLEWIID